MPRLGGVVLGTSMYIILIYFLADLPFMNHIKLMHFKNYGLAAKFWMQLSP